MSVGCCLNLRLSLNLRHHHRHRSRHHLSSSWPCSPSLATQTRITLPLTAAINSPQEVEHEGINITSTFPLLMTASMTTSEAEVDLYDLNIINHDHPHDSHSQLITFNRHLPLPKLEGHNIIGSSQGYLLSVDPTSADLHATSLQNHHNLPPTISLPHIDGVVRGASGDREIVEYVIPNGNGKPAPEPQISYLENRRKGTISPLVTLSHHHVLVNIDDMHFMNYRKVILSPSLDTAVILVNSLELSAKLAFAPIGGSSWIPLHSPVKKVITYCDMIFHDGRLHALDKDGGLAVFDLSTTSSSSSSHQLVSESLPPTELENSRKQYCRWRRFLVESPDGNDLFSLICCCCCCCYGQWKTHPFQVFKLDKRYCKWNRVESIGDIALFVGLNHSSSLSARDFPNNNVVKPNCIYFTESWDDCRKCPRQGINVATGVFNLEDGTIQDLTSNPGDGCGGHDGRSAIWLLPSTC